MPNFTPEEVLRAMREDLQARGLTQAAVAERTGYRTRQAVAKILSGNTYLLPSQALRFQAAFGYDPDFMMYGKGSLRGVPEEYVPHILKALDIEKMPTLDIELPDMGNLDTFSLIFRGFISSLMENYGDENVAECIHLLERYVQQILNNDMFTKRMAHRYFKTGWREELDENSEDYRKFLELEKNRTVRLLHEAYERARIFGKEKAQSENQL